MNDLANVTWDLSSRMLGEPSNDVVLFVKATQLFALQNQFDAARLVIEAVKECWSNMSKGTDPVVGALEAYDRVVTK